MSKVRIGQIVKINGNMVSVNIEGLFVIQNEVAFIVHGDERLKAEVIRIRGDEVDLQVFEDTVGFSAGNPVEFSGELLSVDLGPGLLGQIYDGLQNPLPVLADEFGFFLKRGAYSFPLDKEKLWHFTPQVREGDKILRGDKIGFVPEKIFQHHILAPFSLRGFYRVQSIVPPGDYRITDRLALLEDSRGRQREVTMHQRWPIKLPIRAYEEKLKPDRALVSKMRVIDTLFPVALGGTYCVPGPFGAGKTVLQQLISRHAEVDVVIIAACGERAGEVVETIKTFPHLTDPRTGQSLSDRTVIICNTSSMPVAARESSVYTAVTIAEYYRQLGLHVLLLADSTSRWAQAMREMSGRLEEIPGEEAFPSYLESRIASFYERAGIVLLNDGSHGSVTIGGTISPAGGNFEEPVTQATLKVVGAFQGLSRERSNARKFPSIDPLISWSKYTGSIPEAQTQAGHAMLRKSSDVSQMMKVIGEEGTALGDFVDYLKGDFFDFAYVQQNAFDPVDEATVMERQAHVYGMLHQILTTELVFESKDSARFFFQQMGQLFRTLNATPWQTEGFTSLEKDIGKLLEKHISHSEESGHA
ncbi:MAG: V-type ATP synthase subunit A [Syntrophales bacterium]|jgi:V/A-type H+-transporting ATPase subunit A|nr:V-type ATP synthase subunit A [Syntrophales bacterium]